MQTNAWLTPILRDVALFCTHASELDLRSYQVSVAHAIIASVLRKLGLTFVVLFPRQSGKNELQAQIEAYLLTLFCRSDAEIVKVSPTWKPQSLNAMRRLERVLARNILTRGRWKKENGYIYRLETARIFFLSGGPEANIVGATASTLLEVDEAQDVDTAKFDKDIAPMAASTNATRVFWGTAWTSVTLLARELRAARTAEEKDGIRRSFCLTAEEVAAEVPAYGAFVAGQVARLGRQHPMVRTQFFSEEIDAASGMFPPARLALMRGEHPSQVKPAAGELIGMLLDVAGEDEGSPAGPVAPAGPGGPGGPGGPNGGLYLPGLEPGPGGLARPGRDSTALTVVGIDLSGLSDPLVKAPTYRALHRRVWTGVAHTRLYAELLALAHLWNPRYFVVDATGLGAGLAAFLSRALPGRVIRFTFTASSKSSLGWGFLAVVETGRWKDHADPTPEQDLFWRQLAACQMESSGAEQKIRWGAPDHGSEHDDLALSAALVAVLDRQPWVVSAPGVMIQARDPLDNHEERF